MAPHRHKLQSLSSPLQSPLPLVHACSILSSENLSCWDLPECIKLAVSPSPWSFLLASLPRMLPGPSLLLHLIHSFSSSKTQLKENFPTSQSWEEFLAQHTPWRHVGRITCTVVLRSVTCLQHGNLLGYRHSFKSNLFRPMTNQALIGRTTGKAHILEFWCLEISNHINQRHSFWELWIHYSCNFLFSSFHNPAWFLTKSTCPYIFLRECEMINISMMMIMKSWVEKNVFREHVINSGREVQRKHIKAAKNI